MTDNGAVTRSVLADQIKERLLEGIFDGSYPPDTRIVETAVAKEFGTSQAPVREALRGLEALGVIEIQPFRGARVRRFDRDELVEAYAVRSMIESLGARLAVPRMTEDDIAELVGLGKAMHEAARAGDGLAVARIDAQLHGGIIERSGNRTLVRLWRSLEPLSRTYITLVVPGADPLWTARLHDPILDALRRRDSRAVVKTLQQHFTEAGESLTARLARAETTTDDRAAQPAQPAQPMRAARSGARLGKTPTTRRTK